MDFLMSIYRFLSTPQDLTVADMPLAGSPLPPFIIMLTYFLTVKHIGPFLMHKRRPTNPRLLIMCYNIGQVIANAILFYLTTKAIFFTTNNLTCLKIDRSSALISYYFYLNKITDLTDTYFFLMKKSYRQITYLHVYHHIMVIFCSYLDIFFQAGGLSMYIVLMNTFVHVIMYTYYYVSCWQPDLPLLKRVKHHVTQIQLTQFVVGFFIYLSTWILIECKDKKKEFLLILGVSQYGYLVYIFGDFYMKTYWKNKNQ